MLASMQKPLQLVSPALHEKPHVPPLQKAEAELGALQTFPQRPQFLASVFGSMHAPPHSCFPWSQATMQVLFTQLALPPAGLWQAVPQAPQLAGLEVRSTHAPLQSTRGGTHWSVHVDAAQTRSSWHSFLQLPQCPGSLVVSTHASPHRENPALQTVPHFPARQMGRALVSPGHAAAQPPQFFGSVAVSTQRSPQRTRPPAQTKSHAPETHTGVVEGGDGQAVAHPPQ